MLESMGQPKDISRIGLLWLVHDVLREMAVPWSKYCGKPESVMARTETHLSARLSHFLFCLPIWQAGGHEAKVCCCEQAEAFGLSVRRGN